MDFSNRNHDRPPTAGRTFRPRVEQLESRRMLTIGPTPAPLDTIEFEQLSLQAVLDEILEEKVDYANLAGTGEIHGQKWNDLNGDGNRDLGEPGLDGWTIELVDPADGSVVATTVTAGVDLDGDGTINPGTEAGLYSFTDLARGRYEVREVVKPDWVQTFPLIATGELSSVQLLRDGQEGVDGLDGAESVTVSPYGHHVYTVGLDDDAVAVFSREGRTGKLSLVQILRDGQNDVDGLDGARSVTVSPDGNHVYVASFNDKAVVVFDRDRATGQLTFGQVLRDGQNDVDGLDGARSVTVSPDGNHVYVASFSDNAVVAFERNGATGQLTFEQVLSDGQDGVDGLAEAFAVTVSPDGNHVYAAGRKDDAVVMFRRDEITGLLDFAQLLRNGQEGVEGLDGARSLALSPSGNHVYAASSYNDALVVFRRDGATGELNFMQMLRNGQNGVNGLDGACSVTASPDGSHVYVASSSYYNNALVVFSRDETTGLLDFVRMFRSQDGVEGLVGAHSVTVTPDGNHVYTASYKSDAVVVFNRTFIAGPYQEFLDPGDILTGRDFGNHDPASISGQNIRDLNDNGVRDSGEVGLDGWTIELVDPATGTVLDTCVTAGVDLDENGTIDPETETGLYSFERLLPGSYEVREVLEPDWVQTSPNPSTYSITLAYGQDLAGQDFGNRGTGEINGQKWHDLSANGTRDPGDIGLDGWIIELVDRIDDSVVASTVTASVDLDGDGSINPETEAGLYWFTGLPQGNYEVWEVGQAEWIQTFPLDLGPYEASQTQADAFYPNVLTFDFLDAGVPLDNGTLTVSTNTNLSSSGGYLALKAEEIDLGQLFRNNGTDGIWVTTVVDLTHAQLSELAEDGAIAFTVTPSGWVKPRLGPEELTLGLFYETVVKGGPHAVSVALNDVVTGLDFGNYREASISGQKFKDLDADGVRDPGDPGLDGWTVELVDPVTGDVIDTQVTAAVDLDEDGTIDPETEMGLYSFTGLTPGDYVVREVVGEGYRRTYPSESTYSLTLLSGDALTAVDFGYAEGGLISGQKFDDANGNGIHDPGEPGLDGWTIELVDPADGSVRATTVTASVDLDQDGHIDPETEAGLYSFINLPPGGHEVREVAQPDWVQTSPLLATDELNYVETIRDAWDGSSNGLDYINSVTMSPDGEYVYATSGQSYLNLGAVLVFRRDEASGGLTFVQILRDGVDGINGLSPANCVTASPDGNHVYATGPGDDAVVVFRRDPITGELAFVQLLSDNWNGVDGLDGVASVTVSPDGRHVYAAGYLDDAIAAFSRDEVTGQLNFNEVLRNGVDGVDGLDGASSVIVSSDGVHIYVAAPGAMAVFQRDQATGRLTFLQSLHDGEDGVDGLGAGLFARLSPDGNHVYVASSTDDAVTVFRRDKVTGLLSFVEMNQTMLDGTESLTVSPDGNHIFAASQLNRRIVVFRRDLASGGLTFVKLLQDGFDGADGVLGVVSLTISPDGKNLYAADTYGPDRTIEVFRLDLSPGPHKVFLGSAEVRTGVDFTNHQPTLVSGQVFEDLDNNGTHDADEPGLDGRTVELVDPATGTVLDAQVTAAVDLDADGLIDPATESGLYQFDRLAPGDYEVRQVLPTGWVQTQPVAPTYSFTIAYGQEIIDRDFGNWAPPSEIHGQKWNDLNGNRLRDPGEPGLDGWTIELIEPADGSVLATTVTAGVDLNQDGSIDPETEKGRYSFTGLPRGNYEIREVAQPDWMQVSPLTESELHFQRVYGPDEDGTPSSWRVRAATVSPDGKHVYAVGRTINGEIVVFSRDDTTGELNVEQALDIGYSFQGLATVVVSPDGKHVYAASWTRRVMAVFSRDEGTGHLSSVQHLYNLDGLGGAQSVTVSPDGKHVYVGSYDDAAVAVFSRDEVTGELSPVQVMRDGLRIKGSMEGPNSVRVSPNGKHVYLVDYNGPSVVVYSRDGATGELTLLQVLRDGENGVDGLQGAYAMTISPDGNHVYAAGRYADAIAVFSRDKDTGLLDFVQVLRDGQDGVDGLAGVWSVTISPDGGYVYTGGQDENGIGAFKRDPFTGRLVFAQIFRGSSDRFEGLSSTRAVTISPDGKHLYTANFNYDAQVTAFSRDALAGPQYLTLEPDEIHTGFDFGACSASQVVGRHLFYNGSAFDGGRAEADSGDDGAIAIEKQALLPGQTASFANYTSYDKGINGVMADLSATLDMASLHPTKDFEFRMGNSVDPAGWATAPAPVDWSLREGAGVDGSDRITLVWQENAIEKQWLEVTVKATSRTGLTEPDVFYFGNAPGEAGDSVKNTIVNATDEIVARNFQHSVVDPALIDDPYDYNRDGLVNGTDQLVARNNQTNPLSMLRLITAPAVDLAHRHAAASDPESVMELPAALDWQYEYRRASAKRAGRKDIESTVDLLLATDWA